MDRPRLEELLKLEGVAKRGVRFRNHPKSSLAGDLVSSVKGQGLEFDQVRQYVSGDEIRRIDWRVTARTGKTHVKEFYEDKENQITLIMDVGREMQFSSRGKFKYYVGCEIVALLVFAAKHNGEKVEGLFYGDVLDEVRGFKSRNLVNKIAQILGFLCDDHGKEIKAGAPSLSDAIELAVGTVRNSGVSFIVSGSNEIDEELEKNLIRLKRKTDVYFCYIFDESEYKMPVMDGLEFSDRFGNVSRVSFGKGDVREYKEDYLRRVEEFKRKCERLGVKVLFVGTGEDVLGVLQQGL
jgi:hypothetical protein